MKSFNRQIILLSVLLLTSCGDSDNSLPPADLTDFKASVVVSLNWKNEILDGVGQQYVYLEPLVIGDTVVLASRQGSVVVFDLRDGETLRQIELNSILSSGVGGNTEAIVIATRNGDVIALDFDTMNVKWRRSVPSEVLATPVIYDDSVIVRSSDGNILALDIVTGNINWSYQQVVPSLTLRGSSSPVVSRDKLFTGLENGRLIALSPSNGEVIWDIALAVPQGRSEINRLVDIDGKAELYGQVLYVTSFQGRIAAVDVTRGQFLWARPFSSNTGVSVDEKAVYSTDEQSHIWAIDRFSGATLWKQDKLQARGVTRPVIFDGYLLVGDYAGYVHLLSREDGHFVARLNVESSDEYEEIETTGILVPPTVIDNQALISTRDGITYSLSINN